MEKDYTEYFEHIGFLTAFIENSCQSDDIIEEAFNRLDEIRELIVDFKYNGGK